MTEKDITLCGHGFSTPATKNMETYLTNRYNQKASNGKRKCVVAVMRLKGMTDKDRKEFHDAYKTILGRNIYSQARRSYVFTPYSDKKYYSDCSSSGCACYEKAGFKVGLLNTAGIYTSSKFQKVDVKIKNGHITNPEVLKVGDALLFIGNDPSRPLQIGHVEYVYSIKSNTSNKKDTENEETIKLETAKSQDNSKAGKYIVNVKSGTLSLRAGAGTNKTLIASLAKGSTVESHGQFTGDWLFVIANKNTGFVHSKYLKKVK